MPLAAHLLVALELSCREQVNDKRHVLKAKDVMTSRIVPLARLFEVGGRTQQVPRALLLRFASPVVMVTL